MNNPVYVSAFLLERYHIGEVTHEEKIRVEKALVQDSALAAELAELEKSDRDFYARFSRERFFPGRLWPARVRINYSANLRRVSRVVGLCAAALVLVIALPVLVMRNSMRTVSGDRIKGTSGSEAPAELNVFLKGNSAGENTKLPDQSGIKAGNTVQLAYRVQPDASTERYGVIFSIDGRSVVTMHYPYTVGQSTRLVSGKLVPLDEAYTLDDAPDYEMFFLVTRDKPLETQNILNTARTLAPLIAENPQGALQQGTAAFENYEVQILTLRKE